jgi:hypothetical protein
VYTQLTFPWEGSFAPDPNRPPDLEVMKEACLVVDVLGADYRWALTELRPVASSMADVRYDMTAIISLSGMFPSN